MSSGDLNWITNFIWGIADDVLRDLFEPVPSQHNLIGFRCAC